MLNIDLLIENKEIHVFSKFTLSDDASSLCFCLNKTLEIIKITDENGKLYFPLCESVDSFGYPFNLINYTIKPECNAKQILIEYRGTINSRRHNIITDDCIALNYNSAWYPQKTRNINAKVFSNITVNIFNVENYKVIKRVDNSGIWTQATGEYDVNIIALKNYVEIKYDSFSFSYLKSCENEISVKYVEYLGRMLDYYRELYEVETFPKFDIVVLPNTDPNDGYKLEQLLIAGGFNKNIPSSIRAIANQIAHIWCRGADETSWEDWLNETFAEWSALLFVYDHFGNYEFERGINSHRRDDLLPIKPIDGKRSRSGVHDSGTLMLYELYLLYGKNMIIKLIKIFCKLENKTTKDYLSAIRKNQLYHVASYIENTVYN